MRCLLFAAAVLLVAAARGHAQPPSVAELVHRLDAGTPGERAVAAETLGQHGPAAADAAPALAKLMRTARLPDVEPLPFGFPVPPAGPDDTVLFTTARDALVRIGPKAVPALVEALGHESREARGLVAEALGALGADAAPAVPALAKLLADDSRTVRMRAADALERIGPKAEAAVPALVAVAAAPGAPDPRFPTVMRLPGPKVAAVRALVAVGPAGRAAAREKVAPALAEEYKAAQPDPGEGPALDALYYLMADAAVAAPAVRDYVRRRERTWDQDRVAPALLALGPAGCKAFEDLLADPKIDRVVLLSALANERKSGGRSDLTPLVPALLRAMHDPDRRVRGAAGTVLYSLGEKTPPEAIDLLAARLPDPDPGWSEAFGRVGRPAVRPHAVDCLQEIGGAAKDALPALRALTRGPDARLAAEASAAAARISLDPKDAAVAVGWLSDPDPARRLDALVRAKEIGPLAAAYQSDLVPLLTDADPKVREEAYRLVRRLGPAAPDLVAAAARQFRADGDRWRWLVALDQPLGRAFRPAVPDLDQPLGRSFRPAVPELVKLLEGPDDYGREVAARALGGLGPAARAAVPALAKRLAAEREPGRQHTLLAALGAIGPGAGEAMPFIGGLSLPVREALLCLGGIGPAAKDAVPTARRYMTSADPDLRLIAAYALARIEGDRAESRGAFERALLPPVGRGRALVPTVFSRLAPDYPELVPAATTYLQSLEVYEVKGMLAGLAKYGPAAKPAVPELVKLLDLPNVGWALPERELVETLGAIGPEARVAVPVLRRLLDHRDVWVAVAARDALARIEPAKPAD